ncbi:MAG: hypothetical protein AB2A00_23950 [Myxococcota bacterium]
MHDMLRTRPAVVAISLAQALLGTAAAPARPPLHGTAGEHADGYPKQSADQLQLRRMLREGRHAELNAAFAAYQQEFEKDWHREEWVDGAASAFAHADPHLGPLLDAWVQKHPEHWAAWTCRAAHRLEAGWDARGKRFANKTPQVQLDAWRRLHDDALADLARAAALRADVMAVHLRRIRAAGASQMVRHQALKDSRALCSSCFTPFRVYMPLATRRWVGTDDINASLARELTEAQQRNPRLAWLHHPEEGVACVLKAGLRKPKIEDLEICNVAVGKEAWASRHTARGMIHYRMGRLDAARADLDRAVMLEPFGVEARATRAMVLAAQGEWVSARDDIIVARSLSLLGDGVEEATRVVTTVFEEEARSMERRSAEVAAQFREEGKRVREAQPL